MGSSGCWTVGIVAAGVLALAAADARAHGGTHPTPYPSGSPKSPSKPGKGSTAYTNSIRSTRWEDWWDLNRWRFLRINRRRPQLTGQGKSTKFADTAAGRFLHEATRDAYWDTRAAACIAWGKAGDPEDAKVIRPKVFDKRQEVRGAAMLGLGVLHADLRAAEVLKTFQDRRAKSRLRGFAALALGLSQDAAAVIPLAKRMLDVREADEVRAAAALALGPMGQLAAIPHLRRILDNVNQPDTVRAMATSAMGRLAGVGYARRAKGEKLGSSDEVQGRAAKMAAAMLDPDYVHELLLRLLRADRSSDVRRAAVFAIGRLGKQDDIPALIRAMHDTDYGVELFAMVTVGELAKGTKYVRVLQPHLSKKALTAKYPGTRAWAALALGLLGEASAGPTLMKVFISGRHQTLRGAGATALGLLRWDKAVNPLLQEGTARGNPTLRAHAIFALGMIGAERAMEPLRLLLFTSKTPSIKAAAAAALAAAGLAQDIGKLAKLLKEKSAWLRMSVVQALGILRDDAALTHLMQHFRGESVDEVRALTVVAIGNIVARKPHSVFQELARDTNYLLHCPSIEQAIRLR